MPRTRKKKPRPTSYQLKGCDVVIAALASEATERREQRFIDKLHEESSLLPREVKKFIVGELKTAQLALVSASDNGDDANARRRAMDVARLLVYEQDAQYRRMVNRIHVNQTAPDPDPAAAARSVAYLLRRIEGMESSEWWKKLRAVLEA